MTVSLVLIVVLLQVFSATTTTWQRGEAQMDAFREARGALQLMARDLSTTVQPSLVQANGTANTGNPLLPTLALRRYPSASPERDGTAEPMNEEAYALTNTIDQPTPPPSSPDPTASSTPSILLVQRAPDLCAVGYFCQWMPDIAPTAAAKRRAPKAFALMRQYLNGDDTSARIQTAVNAHGGGSTTSLTPLSFLDVFERASLVPGSVATTNPPVGRATQLAAFIWDLKFRIDTNMALAGDSQSPASAKDHSVPSRFYDGASAPYPATLPSYLEIRFKAMSSNASRRIDGNTSATPADWLTPATGTQPSNFYKSYVLPSTEQFVLRVPLINSNPLPTASPTP